MKTLSILAVLILGFGSARGVQLDDFGGNMAESCPAPLHRVTATCSQSGTTQTCTIANATITADPNYSLDYDVTISSPAMSFIIGVGEPMLIGGTGTALDWVYVAPNLDYKNGASIISAVNTSTGAITLTAYASATVAATAGWIEPGRYYDPFSQGTQIGVTPTVAQFTVNDANGKPTYPICTPEGHRVFIQAVSLACMYGALSLCGGSFSITSASASAGVVTATLNTAEDVTPGEMVTISGVSGTGFNLPSVQLQSVNQSTNTVTYNDPAASGTGSGGTLTPISWVTRLYGGSATLAASTESAKAKAIGFNTIGEDSESCITIGGSCPTANIMPSLNIFGTTVASPSLYSSSNLWGYISAPVKDFSITLTSVYPQGGVFNYPGGELDWFNPEFPTYFRSAFGNTPLTINPAPVSSPSIIANMSDDSDFQHITDGSGLFRGYGNSLNGNGGGQFWHVGALLAVASPHQSVSNHQNYGNPPPPYLFTNTTVYSKTLSTTAPAGCWSATASTTPAGSPVGPTYAACTWPDWVRNWYGTVAAMNAAWGSNYTTFGSSETVVTGATVGTGNGTATAFSAALAGHAGSPDITPTTVQIYLTPSGGSPTLIAGDCPTTIEAGCPSGTAGTGQFLPNTTTLRGFPAGHWVEKGYTFIDPNNDVEVVTSARGVTGTSAPAWPAAPCNGQTTTSGTVTFTCIGPALTSASTINYSTGALSLTFSSPPPSGVAITVSYTWGGWASGIGTGLADESGTGSWVGTNPICVINPPAWQANHSYTAYQAIPVSDPATGAWMLPITTGTSGATDPSVPTTVGTKVADGSVTWASIGGPVCAVSGGYLPVAINANQNWAIDVTNWAGQLMYEYGNALQVVNHQLWPDLINLGVNFSLQSYDVPMYAPMLQAVNATSDGAFTGQFPTPDTVDAMGTQKYIYLTQFYHKPILNEMFMWVSSGWDMTQVCTTWTTWLCAPSLAARSQLWYTIVSNELNLPGFSGVNQNAGVTWFGNISAQNQGFGYETHLGNLLNGVDNVSATVPCAPPFSNRTCGGELPSAPWNGQDVINGLNKQALTLWLTGTPYGTAHDGASVVSGGTSLK